MVSIDVLTIAGIISVIALVVVIFTLCMSEEGCNKPTC